MGEGNRCRIVSTVQRFVKTNGMQVYLAFLIGTPPPVYRQRLTVDEGCSVRSQEHRRGGNFICGSVAVTAGIARYRLRKAQLAGFPHSASDVALDRAGTQGVAADSRIRIHERHILCQTYYGKFRGRVGQTAAAGTESA